MVSPELAGQAGAVEGEAIQGTKSSYSDLLRTEEFAGDRLDLFAGDRFDAGQDLVERVEAAEVQLLPREVGHAGAGGLKREHQRALKVVLGAQQFFFGDER